jgi:hypothetical protein
LPSALALDLDGWSDVNHNVWIGGGRGFDHPRRIGQ